MDHDDLAWDDLRYVRAVADAGSVRAGAATLGVSHQTVARHIARLERVLGLQLFVRSPAGHLPTPAAEDLVRTAVRVDELIGDSARRLARRDLEPAGLVRLTTVDWLLPPLAEGLATFCATYPAIRLELLGSTDVAKLARREADVALRLMREPSDELIGRRLAVSRAGIYASEGYLADHPETLPLDQHAWVAISGVWERLRPGLWLREHVPPEQVVARCSVAHAVPSLLEAGVGVGLLPCFEGDANPRLRRVRPDLVSALDVPIWLLTHSDVRRTARVRAIVDFLADWVASHRDRFAGVVN
jgi:DNA-binding transcriptional LysR family regulator